MSESGTGSAAETGFRRARTWSIVRLAVVVPVVAALMILLSNELTHPAQQVAWIVLAVSIAAGLGGIEGARSVHPRPWRDQWLRGPTTSRLPVPLQAALIGAVLGSGGAALVAVPGQFWLAGWVVASLVLHPDAWRSAWRACRGATGG
ncbi:hypothetical protein [Haloechinothrix sp. LS1_15]|uniref:hypothetical protein n=1 Tax=Haloechinothrix sp. LS1_15 TaxID=2652248 RepID=UPI0029482AF7|nr:hypothetical protein [Haloechinothrix sp. LS1_15]MDV6011794.1 hypothetical protein [Haloechinothrix sp. LS1_15]